MNVPIDRIDLTTGERVNWINVSPPDPAGVLDIMPMRITPTARRTRTAIGASCRICTW